MDDTPLQSAEHSVTANTTYEAINLEDCQPHLKAQDEEPHIYEEISRGGLDGTGHPPDLMEENCLPKRATPLPLLK